MLKDRSELEKSLINWIAKNTVKTMNMTTIQKSCLKINEKYNIPIAMSSDILSQRKDISEYNEFVLYAITDIIQHDKIKEYFTPQEIKLYSNKKYDPPKTSFPLKLHLIKIADDQYIGKVTAQFLMGLREQQLINYNADTQRALRIMLRGGTKIARPYVDTTAVGEIDDSFAEGTFIPNMLTLNINLDDEEADYQYNDTTETLTVSNLTAFDIVDGYHRYLGMSRNYDRDNTWDYVMILQVTMFSVGRAKQFIWQEDHKTKMKITDARTYDQYNAGNIIVNRLNTDPECYINKCIGGTDGIINAGILSQAINRLYAPKKIERKQIIAVTKELKTKFNNFTEEYSEYLEREWGTYEILLITYGLAKDYTPDQIHEAINTIGEDEIHTLNRIKDINNSTTKIMKEVY